MELSSEEGQYPGRVPHHVVMITIWIVGFLMNICSAVLVCRRTRKSPSSVNLLLLVMITALLVMLVIAWTPAAFSILIGEFLHEYKWLCAIDGVSVHVCTNVNLSVSTLLSVDRYFAMCHPFTYNVRVVRNRRCTVKLVAGATGGTLVLAVLLAVIPFCMGFGYIPLFPPHFCYADLERSTAYCSLLAAFVLLLVLVQCYCTMFTLLAISKEQWKLDAVSPDVMDAGHYLRANEQEMHLRLCALIILFFVVSILPMMVSNG